MPDWASNKYASDPEVVTSTSPERVGNSDAEGLQIHHKAEHNTQPHIWPTPAEPPRPSRRKLWIVLFVIGVLVALGVGVGIGYAAKDCPASPAPAAATVTVTSAAPPPASTVAIGPKSTDVNRGIVGFAPFACTNDTTYSSPYGVKFGQVCNVDFASGTTISGTPPAAGETVQDIFKTSAYTFDECMDTCAQYNRERGLYPGGGWLPCKALTYNANLTAVFLLHKGDNAYNCILKSGRSKGDWGVWDASNYVVVGSAYMIDS